MMQSLLTSLIVDDEQDAREGLETLLNTFLPEVTVLAKAENASQAIQLAVKHKPELVFLDIKMPGKDGFYVAEELEKLGVETTIVFITAFDRYAISAIRHAAFDFILKPVDPDELVKAVTRYKNLKEKESLASKLEKLTQFIKPKRIRFTTQKGFILIDPDDIIYFQADGNYTEMFLTEERKELITLQIGQIESLLDDKLFVRINRSNIINISYLKEFKRKKKIVEIEGDGITGLKVTQSGLKKLISI